MGVGTIFGVVDVAAGAPATAVYKRPGRDMRSVGYVLYGASTVLVLSSCPRTRRVVCARSRTTTRATVRADQGELENANGRRV